MSSGERTSSSILTPPSSVSIKTFLNSHRSWLAGIGRGLGLFSFSSIIGGSRWGLCTLLDIP